MAVVSLANFKNTTLMNNSSLFYRHCLLGASVAMVGAPLAHAQEGESLDELVSNSLTNMQNNKWPEALDDPGSKLRPAAAGQRVADGFSGVEATQAPRAAALVRVSPQNLDAAVAASTLDVPDRTAYFPRA